MNKLIYNKLSDDELLHKIVYEEKLELYEVIYNRYIQKITDKSYSFLKNKSLAKEFANDILIKVYEKLPKFKGNSSFSSWLYSITYNYLIDYLRKQKHLHYPSWNTANDLPEIIDESTLELAEIDYDNLMLVFEKIHPEEKALLLMKYQDSLSLKDIASSLVISEDAVKMRLKRARARVIYLYHKEFD
ncbi:MAG TPA: RNA polymerase subunit sigma-70 [Bacteroidales bacterium]|nr:RNA polymerase subunit sigma-70 [Bacteroidales bacterium]